MQEQKDSERLPLTKNDQINHTNNQTDDLEGQIRERKKKYIKWGIIGAFVLVALILIIVLPIVLTKDKKPGPDPTDGPTPSPTPTPTPGPTDAPLPYGINPYTVDEKSITYDQISVNGQLNY